MKVLILDSNPKDITMSHSKWAADQYVEALKAAGHAVEIWPLYRMDIPVIDEDVMNAMLKGSNEHWSKLEYEKMTIRENLLQRFMAFDHYVVISPLWNFGVPPQLKALIDVVAVAGKTFKYTESGPVGLLKGTFVHIQASGGVYSEIPEMEFGNRYIEHILSFMGLEEKLALLIEGTNLGDFERAIFQSTLDDWISNTIKDVM